MKIGQIIIKVSKKFFRPNEVVALLGDSHAFGYGCNDNESLATKKPSFEFTLTEKKGECDANCILYVDTIDHLHNRKKHMGSVDVFKDSFQLYVLETSIEAKCHHWEEGKHECTKGECKVGFE